METFKKCTKDIVILHLKKKYMNNIHIEIENMFFKITACFYFIMH